jgi:hypothetical protein
LYLATLGRAAAHRAFADFAHLGGDPGHPA